MGNTPKNRIF